MKRLIIIISLVCLTAILSVVVYKIVEHHKEQELVLKELRDTGSLVMALKYLGNQSACNISNEKGLNMVKEKIQLWFPEDPKWDSRIQKLILEGQQEQQMGRSGFTCEKLREDKGGFLERMLME